MRSVAILSTALLLAGCVPENEQPLYAPYPNSAYVPPQFSRSPPADVQSNPYAAPFQSAPLIDPGPTPLLPPSMSPPPGRPMPESRPPYETPEPLASFGQPNADPTPQFDTATPPYPNAGPSSADPSPDEEQKRDRMYRELHGDPP